MHEQTELVGLKAIARHPVGGKICFIVFYPKFCCAPGTVTLFVKHLCPDIYKAANNKPDISTHTTYFNFYNHPFGISP